MFINSIHIYKCKKKHCSKFAYMQNDNYLVNHLEFAKSGWTNSYFIFLKTSILETELKYTLKLTI